MDLHDRKSLRDPTCVLDQRARQTIPVAVHASGPGLQQLCMAGPAHPDGGPVVAPWSSARSSNLEI